MKKCINFEEHKGTWYIWGNVYFGIIIFSCLSSTKLCLRFLLICFAQEIRGFYQSSLENEVDFTNIMNVSPYILAKNRSFKKLRHVFNTNSKLSQNRTEKQIMPFKATVNWLLVIYDVIYSLVVLTEKLSFFKKQLQGFIISLINSRS